MNATKKKTTVDSAGGKTRIIDGKNGGFVFKKPFNIQPNTYASPIRHASVIKSTHTGVQRVNSPVRIPVAPVQVRSPVAPVRVRSPVVRVRSPVVRVRSPVAPVPAHIPVACASVLVTDHAARAKRLSKRARMRKRDFMQKKLAIKEVDAQMNGVDFITRVLIPQTFLKRNDGIYSLF